MKKNIDKYGNEYCYAYMTSEDGGYQLIKLVKNVNGYWPLSPTRETEEEIRKLEKEKNERLGLNENQVTEIIISTLRGYKQRGKS